MRVLLRDSIGEWQATDEGSVKFDECGFYGYAPDMLLVMLMTDRFITGARVLDDAEEAP